MDRFYRGTLSKPLAVCHFRESEADGWIPPYHYRLWQATGKEVMALHVDHTTGHAALSPDGKFLVTATDDTAQISDVSSGKKLNVLTGHEVLKSVVFSPDSSLLVISDLSGARTWEVKTGKLVARFGRR